MGISTSVLRSYWRLKIPGSGNVTCIGVVFEVAKQDLQLGKYAFFSHAGEMPENLYLENGVPYSVAQVRKLVEQRAKTEIRRGVGEVNRVYPSKEAYLNAVYDTIFGYVEPGRLTTMEKSAIALRMSNGTGEFIRDYIFPKSKEDTVSTISEQLGAYREIRERRGRSAKTDQSSGRDSCRRPGTVKRPDRADSYQYNPKTSECPKYQSKTGGKNRGSERSAESGSGDRKQTAGIFNAAKRETI